MRLGITIDNTLLPMGTNVTKPLPTAALQLAIKIVERRLSQMEIVIPNTNHLESIQ
jgi:hypothetical protein